MLKPDKLLPEVPMGGIYYDFIYSSRFVTHKTDNDLYIFAMPSENKRLEDDKLYGLFSEEFAIGSINSEARLHIFSLIASQQKKLFSGYLLLDLMNLFEKIDALCEWDFSNVINMDIASKLIIELCNKYGLLMREPGLDLPPEIEADRRIEYFGFRLKTFSIEMNNLYRLYIVWLMALRGMANSELRKKYMRLLPNNANKDEVLDEQSGFSHSIGYEAGCNIIKPTIVLNPIDENRRILLIAEAPVYAAKLEMLKLFSTDTSQLGTHMICDRCGNEFISHHANRKLCEECRTNAAKLKAFRAREKARKKERELCDE